jgi:hypothetical protein
MVQALGLLRHPGGFGNRLLGRPARLAAVGPHLVERVGQLVGLRVLPAVCSACLLKGGRRLVGPLSIGSGAWAKLDDLARLGDERELMQRVAGLHEGARGPVVRLGGGAELDQAVADLDREAAAHHRRRHEELHDARVAERGERREDVVAPVGRDVQRPNGVGAGVERQPHDDELQVGRCERELVDHRKV